MKRIAFALSCVCLAGLALACYAGGAGYATIIVRVPDKTTLKVGDHVSTQTGTTRTFYTPTLEQGYTYYYTLEAKWDGGQATRKVNFKAGETVNVDLGQAKIEKKTEEPKKVEPKKIDQPKKVEPKAEPKKEPTVEQPKKKKKKDDTPPQPKVEAKKDDKILGKSRAFLFTYAGALKDLKPGQEAEVWLPVPVSTTEQEVEISSKTLPADGSFSQEKEYGNKALHFKAKAGKDGTIPFEVTYRVTRREVKTDVKSNATLQPRPNDKIERFLQADKLVPITGKPLELIKGKTLPTTDHFAAAKVLYDTVNGHMKYSKEGKGWGTGDSVWACDSKFGNCSDFHSLFISMARGNKIPAKFEMGFPLPPKRGAGPVAGYHCWAWFMPDGGSKGWVPVDISEANRYPEMKDYYFGNLTEDRVQFTTGRDINLEPRQKGAPLNFFIYPYAEVGGQTYPQEKITRSFSYRDEK